MTYITASQPVTFITRTFIFKSSSNFISNLVFQYILQGIYNEPRPRTGQLWPRESL